MPDSNVHFLWRDQSVTSRFTTGVSLHGHTMYSQECLDFLPRVLKQVPGIAQYVAHVEKETNFALAYWTPPLTPLAAARLERRQIETLNLRPLVSLTDHDGIDACIALHLAGGWDGAPVSVEWTVLYEKAILHFGIHNLPGSDARDWMTRMAAYTSAPDEDSLSGLLRELAALPQVLVVLNHPFWLEEGIIEADRQRAVARLYAECLDSIHALELNGTRSWKENSETIDLARQWNRPVVSGGDRHACEPAASINLTNATTFGEFVDEVRRGESHVCFMPHYRESMALRILETAWDILRPYPEYAGRERWTDRIFYRCDDGITRQLSAIWQNEVPWFLKALTGTVEFFATSPMRAALRLLVMRREQIPL